MAQAYSNTKRQGNGVIKQFLVFFCLTGLFLTLPTAPSLGESATKVGPSGNPLPRFVSLRANKAYLRTGPGRQYPIDWTYKRSGLPLEVVDEHGPWRKVKDHEDIAGWMHVSLLSSKRTGLIVGKTRNLFRENDLKSRIAIIADAGVSGSILECETLWCRLDVDGTKAWIEKRHLWGVYTHEIID